MTYKPVKVLCQLIVGEYDDDGNQVGEHPQQPFALWAPQFGELPDRIEKTMAAEPVEQPVG